MAEDIKTLREATHVIGGVNTRLTLMTAVFAVSVGLGATAFWNVSSKIDAAVSTLNTKIDTTISNFDSKVDKVGSNFDTKTDKIVTALTDLKSGSNQSSQLTQLNDKLAELIRLSSAPKPETVRIVPLVAKEPNSVFIPAYAASDTLEKALKSAPPPAKNVFVITSPAFPDTVPADLLGQGKAIVTFKVKGSDLGHLAGTLSKNRASGNDIPTIIFSPDDRSYILKLQDAVTSATTKPN